MTPKWFTYMLPLMMAVTLAIVGVPCLCTSVATAHAAQPASLPAGQAEHGPCGCPHGSGSEDDGESCCCGCASVTDNETPQVAASVPAMLTQNDDLGLAEVAPQVKALVFAWYVQFVDMPVANAPPVEATLASLPPDTSQEIYLQNRVLRL